MLAVIPPGPLAQGGLLQAAIQFIDRNSISILNVAGPRENSHSGASEYATRFITALLVCSMSKKTELRG